MFNRQQNKFPVLGHDLPPGCPKFIRWDALNEEWADRNHDQTLKRLAERGGLAPCEIMANVERRDWHRMSDVAAAEAIKQFAIE